MNRIYIEIICFLFIVLFLYTGVSKLLDVEKFTVQIGQSPLLTDYAALIAWAIPIIEILISFGLTIPKIRIYSLYLAFGLMVSFTCYIIAILSFSENIPCSCGGVLEKLSWREHLIFNMVFAFIATAGIVFSSKVSRKNITEGM